MDPKQTTDTLAEARAWLAEQAAAADAEARALLSGWEVLSLTRRLAVLERIAARLAEARNG